MEGKSYEDYLNKELVSDTLWRHFLQTPSIPSPCTSYRETTISPQADSQRFHILLPEISVQPTPKSGITIQVTSTAVGTSNLEVGRRQQKHSVAQLQGWISFIRWCLKLLLSSHRGRRARSHWGHFDCKSFGLWVGWSLISGCREGNINEST